MLPTATGAVLEAAGFQPLVDFVASIHAEDISLDWHCPDPQPTDQQINNWATDAAPLPSGKLFSAWAAENGGDALATLRRKAKEALQSQSQEQAALIRAVVIELLNYCNQQRAQHNALLTWLGTQTTLVNRPQLSSMQLTEATTAQAKTAISNRITNGEAD